MKYKIFDQKTILELGYYVYMLLDPNNDMPFYIGKGKENRVFDHLKCALNDIDSMTAKYQKIREIDKSGKLVKHVIVRHGLKDEKHAYQIEASLIDSLRYLNFDLSNLVSGHNSIEKGLMTSDEIIRLYNADPLNKMGDDCIIININRKYKQAFKNQSIYSATKETWTINKKKLDKIKYVLSEYKGLIVEVFIVNVWYPKEREYNKGAKNFGKTKIGYGFNGVVADSKIRDLYLNKSIVHLKKKGEASPVKFKL